MVRSQKGKGKMKNHQQVGFVILSFEVNALESFTVDVTTHNITLYTVCLYNIIYNIIYI